jgi:hypothetical protein
VVTLLATLRRENWLWRIILGGAALLAAWNGLCMILWTVYGFLGLGWQVDAMRESLLFIAFVSCWIGSRYWMHRALDADKTPAAHYHVSAVDPAALRDGLTLQRRRDAIEYMRR